MIDKKAYMEKWHKNNPEYDKQYYRENSENIKGNVKQWQDDNIGKMRKYKKQWRENNSEYWKKWHLENKEYINYYRKNKRKTDLKFNINHKVSMAINKSLKGNKKGKHWESLVEYTLIDLVKHLKKTLPQGYTWQDYLKGKLHIDHKIPITVFNFTKPEHADFKRCWALNNLRLLSARDNLIKNDKLARPFQPALQLCLVN